MFDNVTVPGVKIPTMVYTIIFATKSHGYGVLFSNSLRTYYLEKMVDKGLDTKSLTPHVYELLMGSIVNTFFNALIRGG